MALKINIGRTDGHLELEFVREIGRHTDAMWRLYAAPEKPGRSWRKFKLVAMEPVLGKANFWLSWNGERIGSNSCAAALKKYKPKLYSLTEIALRDMGKE